MSPGCAFRQPGPWAAKKTALSCWKKSNRLSTDLPFISIAVEGDRNILRAIEVLGSIRRYHCDFQLSPRKWKEESKKKVTHSEEPELSRGFAPRTRGTLVSKDRSP